MAGTNTCTNGHPNPAANEFCGTCGAQLSEERAAVGPERRGHRSRATIAAWLGVAATAVAVAGFVVATRGGSTQDQDREDGDQAGSITTTTLTIESMCERELAAWMDWVTTPGNTLMDAGFEYGTSSPSFKVLQDTWSEYQRGLYTVGTDEAGANALDVLVRGCANLGANYEPGHMPPQ